MLATGNITDEGGNEDTKVAFKNCAPFTRCETHINDEHVETADDVDIMMSMYNLLENSGNCSDLCGNSKEMNKI